MEFLKGDKSFHTVNKIYVWSDGGIVRENSPWLTFSPQKLIHLLKSKREKTKNNFKMKYD